MILADALNQIDGLHLAEFCRETNADFDKVAAWSENNCSALRNNMKVAPDSENNNIA